MALKMQSNSDTSGKKLNVCFVINERCYNRAV